MHLLKTEIVQCFATEINMIYKYDFFFLVSVIFVPELVNGLMENF